VRKKTIQRLYKRSREGGYKEWRGWIQGVERSDTRSREDGYKE
jgi:hypothetical protein